MFSHIFAFNFTSSKKKASSSTPSSSDSDKSTSELLSQSHVIKEDDRIEAYVDFSSFNQMCKKSKKVSNVLKQINNLP